MRRLWSFTTVMCSLNSRHAANEAELSNYNDRRSRSTISKSNSNNKRPVPHNVHFIHLHLFVAGIARESEIVTFITKRRYVSDFAADAIAQGEA